MTMATMHCGHCHTCGSALRKCLDGEEWCPRCGQYRRYLSHGWCWQPGDDNLTPCLDEPAEEDEPAQLAHSAPGDVARLAAG